MVGSESLFTLPFAEQLGRILLLIFVCGLIGFSWGKYNGLPGFGAGSRLARGLPRLALLGVVLGLLIFFVADSYFIEKVPYYYPQDIWFALSVPFYAVFVEEIFTRFGLMTLGVRILKNIHIANFLSALLFAFGHVTLLSASGLPYRLLNYLTLTSFTVNLGTSLTLGYVFAHYGLGASMFVQFVANLRFLAASLIQ